MHFFTWYFLLQTCLSFLRVRAGTLPEETAQELEYCSRYRIFLVLLKEIAKPKPPMDHAFLSFFLSDIGVKPYHRVVAIRMAIRHNITSQNFGIASGLIQVPFFDFSGLLIFTCI